MKHAAPGWGARGLRGAASPQRCWPRRGRDCPWRFCCRGLPARPQATHWASAPSWGACRGPLAVRGGAGCWGSARRVTSFPARPSRSRRLRSTGILSSISRLTWRGKRTQSFPECRGRRRPSHVPCMLTKGTLNVSSCSSRSGASSLQGGRLCPRPWTCLRAAGRSGKQKLRL